MQKFDAKKIQNLPTEKVESSNIKAIGYDPKDQLLVIHFKNSRIYAYKPVPQEVFLKFKKAESLGKFFTENIRANKLYECVELV